MIVISQAEFELHALRLAEIGPMDAKAAIEHVKTFDTGAWAEEWGFEMTAALEGKAK